MATDEDALPAPEEAGAGPGRRAGRGHRRHRPVDRDPEGLEGARRRQEDDRPRGDARVPGVPGDVREPRRARGEEPALSDAAEADPDRLEAATARRRSAPRSSAPGARSSATRPARSRSPVPDGAGGRGRRGGRARRGAWPRSPTHASPPASGSPSRARSLVFVACPSRASSSRASRASRAHARPLREVLPHDLLPALAPQQRRARGRGHAPGRADRLRRRPGGDPRAPAAPLAVPPRRAPAARRARPTSSGWRSSSSAGAVAS